MAGQRRRRSAMARWIWPGSAINPLRRPMTPCVPCPVSGAGQPISFAFSPLATAMSGRPVTSPYKKLCGDYVAGRNGRPPPKPISKAHSGAPGAAPPPWCYGITTEPRFWPNAAARKAWPVAKPPGIDNTDIRDLTKAFMDTRFFLPFPADGPFRGGSPCRRIEGA